MSNIAPAQIFHLVAGVYGITVESMSQRTSGCYKTLPRHIEARSMAVYLTFRHTQETKSGICRVLGFATNGEARGALARQAQVFADLAAANPALQALLERVETEIDRIHDATLPPIPPLSRRALKRERVRRIKSLPPVDVGEMTDEWWQVNDMKFRRALLEAAE